jgi:hypothetical protein
MKFAEAKKVPKTTLSLRRLLVGAKKQEDRTTLKHMKKGLEQRWMTAIPSSILEEQASSRGSEQRGH